MASLWVIFYGLLLFSSCTNAESPLHKAQKKFTLIEARVRQGQYQNVTKSHKLVKPFKPSLIGDASNVDCSKLPGTMTVQAAKSYMGKFDGRFRGLGDFLDTVGNVVKAGISAVKTGIEKVENFVTHDIIPHVPGVVIAKGVIDALSAGTTHTETVHVHIEQQKNYNEELKKYDEIICQNKIAAEDRKKAEEQRKQTMEELNKINDKMAETIDTIRKETEEITKKLGEVSADIVTAVHAAASGIEEAVSDLGKVVVSQADRLLFTDKAAQMGATLATYRITWQTILQPEEDILESTIVDTYLEACDKGSPLVTYGEVYMLLKSSSNIIRTSKTPYTDDSFFKALNPYRNVLDQFLLTFPLCQWLKKYRSQKKKPTDHTLQEIGTIMINTATDFDKLVNETNAARFTSIMNPTYLTNITNANPEDKTYTFLKNAFAKLLYTDTDSEPKPQSFLIAQASTIIDHSFKPERVVNLPNNKIVVGTDKTDKKRTCDVEINNFIHNESKMAFCGFLTQKEEDQKPSSEINSIVSKFTKTYCGNSNYVLLHFKKGGKYFGDENFNKQDFQIQCTNVNPPVTLNGVLILTN